jgi:hypothetical protein
MPLSVNDSWSLEYLAASSPKEIDIISVPSVALDKVETLKDPEQQWGRTMDPVKVRMLRDYCKLLPSPCQ